jgi:uncharacterized protein involved in outer membrane biogenesis
MKKFVIALIVLVLLVVAAAGWAVYNANNLVQQYQPTLEAMAGDALGSDVALGAISVGLYPQVRVAMADVSVRSREITDEVLRLGSASVSAQLWPLLSGQLHVTGLTFHEPSVTLMLEKEGPRLAGIPRNPPPSEEKDVSAATVPIDMDFDAISIRKGAILIEDVAAGARYAFAPYDASASFRATPSAVVLDALHVDAFAGTVDASASLGQKTGAPLKLKAEIKDMDLARVMEAQGGSGIDGTLKALAVNIEGVADETFSASLEGDGRLELRDGLLKNVNLASQILGAMNDVPVLSGALLDAVPDSIQQQLNVEQTILDSVTASFLIAGERATTDDLHMVGDLFSLDGRGAVGFDGELDLQTTVYFNSEFSAALAQSAEEIAVLYDDEGRLVVPVRITGTPPQIRAVPDVGALVGQTIKETVKQKAGELFNKLTGGEDDQENSGDAEPRGGLLDRLKF